MEKAKAANKKNIIVLCFLFFLDEYIFSMSQVSLNHYSWFLILVSACLSCIVVVPYAALAERRKFSPYWKIVLAIPAVLFAIYSLLAFSNFIKESSMPNTPIWLLPFFLLVTALLAMRKKLSGIIQLAQILFAISIIVLILASFFLLPEIKWEYVTTLFSPFQSTWKKELLFYTCIFILKGCILFTFLQSEVQKDEDKGTLPKSALIGLLSAASVIAGIVLYSLLVLGNGLFDRLAYPLYYPLSVTHLSQYFERLEIIFLLFFMTLEFFKITIISAYFSNSIKDLLSKFQRSADK